MEVLIMSAIEEQAALFNALADPARLKILQLLSQQKNSDALCVNALTYMLEITQPAVSQHLKILKDVGLVQGQKRGNHVHYSVNAEALNDCQNLIAAFLNPSMEKPQDPCKGCHGSNK
jgi:ArsR family transcriptional regulator, arsenate/arsenite/antimonite-responsive transcriptional repressor